MGLGAGSPMSFPACNPDSPRSGPHEGWQSTNAMPYL